MYLIYISHYYIWVFFFGSDLQQAVDVPQKYGHYQWWSGCNDHTCCCHSCIGLMMKKYAFDKRYILGSQIHRGLKMKQNKWKRGCIPIWPFKRHYCSDYLLGGCLMFRFSVVTGCNRAEHISPRIRWVQWRIHGGCRSAATSAAEPPLRPHAAGQWKGEKRG